MLGGVAHGNRLDIPRDGEVKTEQDFEVPDFDHAGDHALLGRKLRRSQIDRINRTYPNLCIKANVAKTKILSVGFPGIVKCPTKQTLGSQPPPNSILSLSKIRPTTKFEP